MLRIIYTLSSLKLALSCLIFFAIVVFWGTIYQVEHGLYLAQEDFYYAWLTPPISQWYRPLSANLMSWIMSYIPIPIPGGLLLLWILSINLFSAMLLHVLGGWRRWGIVLIHMGILLMLAGGWFTHLYGEESYISLAEGDATNLASSYRNWEISVSKELKPGREVVAIDADKLSQGDTVHFPTYGFSLIVNQYYPNATPVLQQSDSPSPQNASGITSLIPEPLNNDAGKNIPGGVFTFWNDSVGRLDFLLYGNENRSLRIHVAEQDYFIQLRRRRSALPVIVKLEDFQKEFHPNTDTPRKFSSKVSVIHGDLERSAIIEMNHPFRQDGYTLYQSRYAELNDGTQVSIFAVTKNYGRFIPYVATGITVVGLLVHFLTQLIRNPFGLSAKKRRSAETTSNSLRRQGQHMASAVFWLSLLMATGPPATLGNDLAKEETLRLNEFGRIPVLEGGRKMPLDTYAHYKLLQFSGRNKFPMIDSDGNMTKIPALAWLAQVLLTPTDTVEDKIFLVNHPEVAQALGLINTQERDRYSFAQLQPSLGKLDALARRALAMEESQRSLVENELIQLYSNVLQYNELTRCFHFARPNHDFIVKSDNVKLQLGLNRQQEAFSVLDLFHKAEELEDIWHSLSQKDPSLWTVEDSEYASLWKFYREHLQRYRSIRVYLVPTHGNRDEQWVTPWEILASSNHDMATTDVIHNFAKLVTSYTDSDQVKFDIACKKIRSFSIHLQPDDRELKTIGIEILLNRIRPFMWAKTGYFLAFLLAFLVLLTGGTLRKVAWISGISLILITLVPHTYGILARMLITGRPPVTNLFTTFIFVGWICVSLGLIVEIIQRHGIGALTASFSGLVLLLISGRFATDGDTMHKVVAVLDSNFWLSTHVLCITTGYAGCFLAGVIGHVYLILASVAPNRKRQLEAVSRMLYGLLGFGLTFSFLGTMLGGVWADQSWGRFWGWDPKENGALLIVLWCAILFHARLANVIGIIGMAAGSALGIIVVMLAWLGVNLLSIGLHSYGFTSGLAVALQSYTIIQMFIVAVLSPIAHFRSHAKENSAAA